MTIPNGGCGLTGDSNTDTSSTQKADRFGLHSSLVSPGMIRQRYNRLVEQGFLKIVAITNPVRMGFRTMAMIGIRADGSKLLEVADKVSRLEEVIYMIITSGRFDIFAEVVCRDHEELLRFMTEKLSTIEGVRDTESFMHLKIVKEIYF